VGNEQVGQVQSLLQLRQKIDDLGLDGNVKRRYGLITNNEFRLERQCPGHTNALALSTRELMRIPMDMGGTQANQLQ
jgi:hypothetical protein